MFVLIEDGSITKHLNGNRGITIGGIQYPKAIFTLWTAAEREAIGLYEVIQNNAKKKDEAYYINTNQTFTYDADAGTVTATYGDATAKAHADANATDSDGVEVVIEGLKTIKIRTVKAQAAGELNKTDWYITRNAEKSTAIPSAITTHRDLVRSRQAAMETSITNASDTPALETLYTYTKDSDGVVSRPLAEIPTLD